MSWGEFHTLLSGILPETPLGQIVQIRSEEDKDKLKAFTPEQHRIRDEWQVRMLNKRHEEISKMSDEEKEEQVKKIQDMFAKEFGQP